jgi:hypothetical protein
MRCSTSQLAYTFLVSRGQSRDYCLITKPVELAVRGGSLLSVANPLEYEKNDVLITSIHVEGVTQHVYSRARVATLDEIPQVDEQGRQIFFIEGFVVTDEQASLFTPRVFDRVRSLTESAYKEFLSTERTFKAPKSSAAIQLKRLQLYRIGPELGLYDRKRRRQGQMSTINYIARFLGKSLQFRELEGLPKMSTREEFLGLYDLCD